MVSGSQIVIPGIRKRQPLCGGAAHALGAGAGGGALPQHRQHPAPLLPGLLPLGGRGVRGGRGAPRRHPRHPGVATGQGDRPVLRLLRRHLHRRGAPPLHIQHQHPGGGDAGQAPLLRLHTRPPDPLHGRRGHLRRPHRSGRGHRRLLSRPPGPACPGARTAGADLHPGGGAGGDYRSPAGAGRSGGRAGGGGGPPPPLGEPHQDLPGAGRPAHLRPAPGGGALRHPADADDRALLAGQRDGA